MNSFTISGVSIHWVVVHLWWQSLHLLHKVSEESCLQKHFADKHMMIIYAIGPIFIYGNFMIDAASGKLSS